MCPILVSQWNQWGWNPSPVQSRQQFGLQRNNAHTPVPEESGSVMTPYLWTQDKCGTSNKLLYRAGSSKFTNLIPNHHSGITRVNAHCRLRIDCVIWWNQTWNRRPPYHAGKFKGSGGSLLSSQSCMPPYSWNGRRITDWVAEGSPYLKQRREQPLSAFLEWANDHWQVAFMPAIGKFKRVAMVQTPMVEPHRWIWHSEWHLKA